MEPNIIRRLKRGIIFSLLHAFIMFVVGMLLGGEPYWIGVIGFAIGGFVIGFFLSAKGKERKSMKKKNRADNPHIT
ncbi:hypothetical protein [Geomicrobium sediminis]|uniref:AtpZ/AtpI family protein n=1 Tax=Geomicrobium sediminis TaxID=1347788 RepID=A0ABS2PDB5_9BACL|nr:hypothetical protein [Geomicrobium sediminis]MBM7633423.1 hypothetical protein [Geomicrobium sediminis]